MKKVVLLVMVLIGSIVTSVFAQINSNSPAVPFGSKTSYAYGALPTNLPTTGAYGQAQDAADAYTLWKSGLVETCSDGSIRVKSDNTALTVSEGIAYGMLLSAYAGDKPTFDGLWKYYKKWSNQGVMHWRITGCSAIEGQNGATDAELDAAMALIIAAEQWPSATSPYTYVNEAKTLMQAIKNVEMETNGDIKPGNAWNTCRNPSYYSPAYFREYAKVDVTNATFWNTAAARNQEFLLLNRHATTGLVSNWATFAGVPTSCNGGDASYGWEAIRNPWRMATDVLWNGKTLATTGADICTKVAAHIKGDEANLRIPCATSAKLSTGTYKNGTAYMTGLATLGANTPDQTSINAWYSALKSIPGTDVYFSRTLRCISLFMASGNFWKPGSNTNAAPAVVSAVSDATGKTITVSFSKNMAASPSATGLTVNIDGAASAGAISTIALSGTKDYVITLAAGKEILAGQTVTLSYTPGTLKATDNLAVAAFTNRSVTNGLAGNSTIIADCEAANETKLLTYWYSYAAGKSTIVPLASELTPFTMTLGGANGTDSAAVVTGNLAFPGAPVAPSTDGYESAGIGFPLTDPEGAYDLTGATGISFWHKGDKIVLTASQTDVTPDKGYEHFVDIAAHTTWTKVEIPFSLFSQPTWIPLLEQKTFDPAKLSKFQWQIKDGVARSYTFSIDEVTIEGKVLTLPDPVDPIDPDVVDFAALTAKIASATTKHTAAVEGTLEGQYAVGSKATLMTAITAATAVKNNTLATQVEVDAATSALTAALATFEAGKVGAVVGGNTLIADCEAANATKLLTYWFSYKDGATTISPLSSMTEPFTMTLGGAAGTDSAAVVSGNLVQPGGPVAPATTGGYESAGIGFPFTELEEAYDLTGATGFSFYHKGDALTFAVVHDNAYIPNNKGYDYQFAVPAHTNWTLVEVPFESLSQATWLPVTELKPFDPAQVTKLQWQVKDGLPRAYTFGIDEVTVMGKTLTLPDPVDPIDPDVVDFAALTAKIASATTKHTAAVEGTLEGQYAVGSKATLMTAITAATAVKNNTLATQLQVDAATSALTAALATFEAGKVGAVVGGNTLIADCEAANATKLLTYWFSYKDGATTISPLSSMTEPFTMTLGGAAGTDSAAVVSGNLVQPGGPVAPATTGGYESAGIGFPFTELEEAYDLTGATGFSFYHKGDALTFAVVHDNAYIPNNKGYDYQFAVPAHTNWTLVEVPFTSLSQATWLPVTELKPFDPAQVTKLQWQVKDGLPRAYTFGIDEVTVMGKTLTLPDPVDPIDPPVLDVTALTAKITLATTTANAASIGTGVGQYTTASYMALQSAISSATNVKTIATTQAQVDAALASLTTAIATFQASVITTPTVVKTALNTSITTAQAAFDAAVVGTAPGNYPADAKAILFDAIAAATTVTNNASATQTAVDNAKTTLDAALATFESKKVGGTVVNKALLVTSISNAESIIGTAVVGTGDGQYPQAAKTTFQTAIDAAKAVNTNVNSTQTQVDAAKSTLDAALVTFQNAKIGTTAADKTELLATIATANDKIATSSWGTDLGQYPTSAKTQLEAAIASANTVANSASVTQSDVNTAKTNLSIAIQTFELSVISVDKSALKSQIDLAQSTYDNANAALYPAGAKTTLLAAITTANSFYTNAGSSQTQVNTAKTNLATALTTFLNSATVVDKGPLQQLLLEANEAYMLSIGNTGTDPGNYSDLAASALEAQIASAQSIVSNPAATQAQITSATLALNDKLSAFNSSQVPSLFDKSDLEDLVAQVQASLENATISSNVNQPGFPLSNYLNLTKEYNKALNVLQTSTSQSDIMDMYTDLNTTYVDFIASERTDASDLSENALVVYPTIVSTVVSVSSEEIMESVVVSNISGNVVSRSLVNALETEISTATLASGMYIVTVTYADGSIAIAKIIKE